MKIQTFFQPLFVSMVLVYIILYRGAIVLIGQDLLIVDGKRLWTYINIF